MRHNVSLLVAPWRWRSAGLLIDPKQCPPDPRHPPPTASPRSRPTLAICIRKSIRTAAVCSDACVKPRIVHGLNSACHLCGVVTTVILAVYAPDARLHWRQLPGSAATAARVRPAGLKLLVIIEALDMTTWYTLRRYSGASRRDTRVASSGMFYQNCMASVR